MSECLHYQSYEISDSETVYCPSCDCFIDWETENYIREEKLDRIKNLCNDFNPTAGSQAYTFLISIYNIIEEIEDE